MNNRIKQKIYDRNADVIMTRFGEFVFIGRKDIPTQSAMLVGV